MENKKLIAVLEEMGLSKNEARIYFAALSLGPTTALAMSREVDIKRPTVYSIIESLKQKGLLLVEVSGLKRKFVAVHPEHIESLLEKRQALFQKHINEFLGVYNLHGVESSIKYYDGLNGIKTVYESMLRDVKPHEDYYVLANIDKWFDLDEKYFKDFTDRRAKLNINIRLLLEDSARAREYKRFAKNFNAEMKILPKGATFTSNLVSIPRRILIHKLTPPALGIVIENESVIEMHRQMYNLIWESLD